MIEASKDGIKFSCQGDIGNGAVTIRQYTDVEHPERSTTIRLSEPVALTFSLKYLVNFCKASALSDKVILSLSQEVPLQVEYSLGSGTGHLRFYLAPKVCTLSDLWLAVLITSLTMAWRGRSGRKTKMRLLNNSSNDIWKCTWQGRRKEMHFLFCDVSMDFQCGMEVNLVESRCRYSHRRPKYQNTTPVAEVGMLSFERGRVVLSDDI